MKTPHSCPHFGLMHGKECPRCGVVVRRDYMGRDEVVSPPRIHSEGDMPGRQSDAREREIGEVIRGAIDRGSR